MLSRIYTRRHMHSIDGPFLEATQRRNRSAAFVANTSIMPRSLGNRIGWIGITPCDARAQVSIWPMLSVMLVKRCTQGLKVRMWAFGLQRAMWQTSRHIMGGSISMRTSTKRLNIYDATIVAPPIASSTPRVGRELLRLLVVGGSAWSPPSCDPQPLGCFLALHEHMLCLIVCPPGQACGVGVPPRC